MRVCAASPIGCRTGPVAPQSAIPSTRAPPRSPTPMTDSPRTRRARSAHRACLARLGALLLGVAMLGALGCASDDAAEAAPPAPWSGPDPIETIDAFIDAHPVDRTDPTWKTHVPRPPFVQLDPTRTYYWQLNTSAGILKIRFRPEWSPHHVSTAIYLTRLGFYDGLTFHRVVPGFMAQGGDPLGDGSGGPGFRIAGEFHKKAKHDERGVLSAANRGPRTDGSQFFITFKEQPELDGKHTVY
ncbi:MAG TPA: peptidylprolyl isomerase, partial [Alphaproteobacteria bacterium]|nr:peptidylprolyl isomerase [Alphaproteobacteria bacterium]